MEDVGYQAAGIKIRVWPWPKLALHVEAGHIGPTGPMGPMGSMGPMGPMGPYRALRALNTSY